MLFDPVRCKNKETFKCGLCRKSFINGNTCTILKTMYSVENKKRFIKRNKIFNDFYEGKSWFMNWNEVIPKYPRHYSIEQIIMSEKGDEFPGIDNNLVKLNFNMLSLLQDEDDDEDQSDEELTDEELTDED
jgi:hypothetical protein